MLYSDISSLTLTLVALSTVLCILLKLSLKDGRTRVDSVLVLICTKASGNLSIKFAVGGVIYSGLLVP